MKLKDYLLTEHQYKFLNPMSSSLLKFLKVRKNNTIEIPRYVIIDVENKIMLNNAPRPSDSVVFKMALDKINLKKEIKTIIE